MEVLAMFLAIMGAIAFLISISVLITANPVFFFKNMTRLKASILWFAVAIFMFLLSYAATPASAGV